MKEKRIAIIGRETERSETLWRQLSQLYPELEVECVPLIHTTEVEFELPHLAGHKRPVYLFTSPRAVGHFFSRAALPEQADVVAIGRSTSRELYKYGAHPSFISSTESAMGMAPEMLAYLSQIVSYSAIIQPTSSIAGDYLMEYFSERGVEYHKVVTYAVATHPHLPEYIANLTEEPAFIVFYSPSGVRAWSHSSPLRPTAISIGPVTTQELEKEGWTKLYESHTPDSDDMLAAITMNIK